MPQNQIIFNSNCFSTAYLNTSGEIILYNDYDNLVKQNDDLSLQVINGEIDSNYLLQKNIEVDKIFFYKIEQLKNCGEFKNNDCLKSETGIGKLTETNGAYKLVRIIHLYQNSLRTQKDTGFLNFKQQSYIKVTATVPENFKDCLIEDFTVIACNKRFVPTPVQLQEKTLLGRLNDQVQSIDSSELRSILGDSNIVDAVESTNKSLSLQSKVVDLVSPESRVTSASFRARPRKRPPNPQRGDVIFNSDSNCFEGYDGTSWVQFGATP